jgi:hypothetical protein
LLLQRRAQFWLPKPVEEMSKLPHGRNLDQSNLQIWSYFGNLVNRHLKGVGLQLCRDRNIKDVSDLLAYNDDFVVLATLKASDGMVGQHAVAIYNGGIYDSNCRYVMKKTRESLDWCCGDGTETCTGVNRSYVLKPHYTMNCHTPVP